jgi:hypothetical protein
MGGRPNNHRLPPDEFLRVASHRTRYAVNYRRLHHRRSGPLYLVVDIPSLAVTFLRVSVFAQQSYTK